MLSVVMLYAFMLSVIMLSVVAFHLFHTYGKQHSLCIRTAKPYVSMTLKAERSSYAVSYNSKGKSFKEGETGDWTNPYQIPKIAMFQLFQFLVKFLENIFCHCRGLTQALDGTIF